jgi:hypothetical protein
MNSFINFIQEEKKVIIESDAHLKTHLSHLEDLAIENGKEGFENFIQHIDEINKKIKGFETNQEMNAKIDGSPMILFGIDPRSQFKNQFFISLKGGLSQANPKIMHADSEVNLFYGDKPELENKLKNLLKYLRQAYDGSGKIYQADVLFALPKDKKIVKIGEENFITFKPNVIAYAVPVDSKSPLSNRVSNSEVGIIVHESFKGKPTSTGGIELISQGRNVDSLISSSVKSKAFIQSSNFSSLSVNISDDLLKKINAEASKAKLYIGNISQQFNAEYLTNPILSLLKIYLNKQVDIAPQGIFGAAARGEEFFIDKFIDGLRQFIASRYTKEQESKKTPTGKHNIELRMNSVLSFLEQNKENFLNLTTGTFHMARAKNLLLQALATLESKVGKTFIQNADGSFTPTKDEGIVLFVGTNHVKLVDRLEFTKINRQFGGPRRTIA